MSQLKCDVVNLQDERISPGTLKDHQVTQLSHTCKGEYLAVISKAFKYDSTT